MSESFTIINKTKGKPPRLPFVAIKNEALGEEYELELVFLDEVEMQIINREHHKKDTPTNILSFLLSKTSGQIFICLAYAKKEAPDFEKNYTNYVGFLFIHGLIHLLGFDHGSTMENEEQKIRNIFRI